MRRMHLEAFKMAPKKAKSIEEGDKAFSCTDDELSLLLKVIILITKLTRKHADQNNDYLPPHVLLDQSITEFKSR